jgi:hypothetical protein
MTAAETFLLEIREAKVFEEARVLGYTEFLSLPNLSADERNEIQEGLNFSSDRVSKLSQVIDSLNTLILDGYPTRELQTASEEILSSLKAKLDAMEKAFSEFDISIKAAITFTTA